MEADNDGGDNNGDGLCRMRMRVNKMMLTFVVIKLMNGDEEVMVIMVVMMRMVVVMMVMKIKKLFNFVISIGPFIPHLETRKPSSWGFLLLLLFVMF